MSNVFLISDLHLGHNGVCHFTTDSGDKLRPWTSAEEMDEALISNWNEVVRDCDKVYVLGDIVMNKKHLHKMGQMRGKKVLIRGNHDLCEAKEYLKYFYDIRGCHIMDGMILTHIPIHEESLARFSVNVHGHLHSRRVMKDGAIDPRYFSVCVEQTDFKPLSLEEVRRRIGEQGGDTIMKEKGE
jgi:calcineurin-like phosphoesterase family protein